MSGHRYRLLWNVEPKPEGVLKADVPPGSGAADALLIASIIYPADGGLSVAFMGTDGRTDTELADSELFKVWSMLAHRLADSRTLSPEKRELAETAFGAVRFMVQRDRRKGSA